MRNRMRVASSALTLIAAMNFASPANATTLVSADNRLVALAQAMVPPTGMMDIQHPMPMNERYLKRFPQDARVGDLIGLQVLDLNSSTLGYVQQVVRPPLTRLSSSSNIAGGGVGLAGRSRCHWKLSA
jgi:hypothetical protein